MIRIGITSVLICCGILASTQKVMNLTRNIGQNLTFNHFIRNNAFLIKEESNIKIIAKIIDNNFEIEDHNYIDKIQYDNKTKLITIINLQNNDSDYFHIVYKETNLNFSYHLQVNDLPVVPQRNTSNVTADGDISLSENNDIPQVLIKVVSAVVDLLVDRIISTFWLAATHRYKEVLSTLRKWIVWRRGSSNEVSPRGSERDEGGSTSIEMESLNPPPPDDTATG